MILKKLLLFCVILISNICLAHQDFSRAKTFGKVKVRIHTGFEYEEIKKAWIIGELASKLVKSLGYGDSVFLDFRHLYVDDAVNDYLISFDDGSISTFTGSEFTKLPIGVSNLLVIREISRRFDALNTLKLIEYAIKNISLIKQQQKPIKYQTNYFQWMVNSIDRQQIKKAVNSIASENVKSVLKHRAFRPKTDNEDDYDITYFFEGGLYQICYNDAVTKNNVLLKLKNVYQLAITSLGEAVVFDTDSTFYYVRGIWGTHTSKKMTIKSKGEYYKPYTIVKVGSSVLAFSFTSYNQRGAGSGERTIIYRIRKDKLTQNLDKALDQ